MIAAIKAQLEKERAAEAAKQKRLEEEQALKNLSSNKKKSSDSGSKSQYKTLSAEELARIEEKKRRKREEALGIVHEDKPEETENNEAETNKPDTNKEAEGEAKEAKTEDNDQVDGNPGEAVLTNGSVSALVAQAKVNREQVRAKNKETLQAIIDNADIAEDQKADAVAQMVEMTQRAEQEVAIETLLASKGFQDAVVSLTEESADVVVDVADLSDAKQGHLQLLLPLELSPPLICRMW